MNFTNKFLLYFILLIGFFFSAKGQNAIPYGSSLDSVEMWDLNIPSHTQSFNCYKPSTYNSTLSPILFAIHGSGGDGMSAINDLIDIAERRHALIIAPNYPFSGFETLMRHQDPVTHLLDTISSCMIYRPSTLIFKEIYKYILNRENRTSIPSFLIGFSAGGQFVTRYMLLRQAYPDSIPIQMAVSSNAFSYTFPTDTFNGTPMPWLCGLIMSPTIVGKCYRNEEFYNWNCNEHVVQYYNENYGVLIGTSDVSPISNGGCFDVQGNNRYERALNFYNFADSNAVTRGTTLQWQYQEVPGVGHDQYAMYNNKANPSDTSSIAETLLFDTPYHTVPFTAPVANFYADTTVIEINNAVNYTNASINATSYFWDFGDSTTSSLTNPSHIYTTVGIYTVQLNAINGTGCDNWTEKRYYIKVINPVSVNEINLNDALIKIYPNPTTEYINIDLSLTQSKFQFILYDVVGKIVKNFEFDKSFQIGISELPSGVFNYKILGMYGVYGVGKIVKQ